MKLSVLVVDDEPIAREGLKLLLGRQPQVESVSEARNGREAIALIREQRPDLVLLDVQMPRTDGFAVVHSVGAERMPPIIFVTAHDQYAIRAFEIAAIDYLLKPVTEERFALAFKRAIDRLRGAPREDAPKQLMAMLDAIANPPRQLERFAVRSGENTSFVPVNEVDWIEAYQNYVRLHAGPATYLLHVPMNTIEGVLDSNRFLRIHRSHIVNIRRIAQLWSIAHGQMRSNSSLGSVCHPAAPTTSASAARLQIHSDCAADFHGGTLAGRECVKASKCCFKPTFKQFAVRPRQYSNFSAVCENLKL